MNLLKGHSAAILLGLLVAAPTSGEPLGPSDALYRHANGESITADMVRQAHLWARGRDLSDWNRHGRGVGSQNHPVIAHAAIGDYEWIAELGRTEAREGLFSRELGAPGYYFYMPIAAKMVALRDARLAGAAEAAEAIRRNLRAAWAYEALLAVATPRTSTWADLSGEIVEGPGNTDSYNGLTVAVAGNRWHKDRYREDDPHGAFLSWALDWRPRSDGSEANLREEGRWWQNIVAILIERDSYQSPADPEPFGLTRDERTRLRRVIQGDPDAVRWAAQIVSDFGVYRRLRIRMRRTSEGTEVIFFSISNGNKPAHAATSITNEGAWRTIRPSYYRGTGANGGYAVRLENGRIIATCAEGRGETVSMDELRGDLIYEITLEGRSVKLTGEDGRETPLSPK